MKIELTPEQENHRAEFRAFVDKEIAPFADQYDREQCLPPGVIEKLTRQGYWGAALPSAYGGRGLDMITYGLLHEQVGRGCSSTRSLLTVHDMVSQVLVRWGTREQKEQWLARLASGEVLGAFALTEPNVGSDASSVETSAVSSGDGYVLNGCKKWITAGQIAGLFLMIARSEKGPTAFLVEKDTPGFSIKPIQGMLGLRAAMLAELQLEDCRIPKENLVGWEGLGLSHVVSTALDHGRYTVAWGCVGIAQACLEACLDYAGERKQFGAYLKDHQLIRQMMTNMIVSVEAARLLCYQAGYLKETGDPDAIMKTNIAKYYASTVATSVASDAVQMHGANGCSGEYPVQRYFRDAKIMEIIEGSTQIQQLIIAKYGYEAQRMGLE